MAWSSMIDPDRYILSPFLDKRVDSAHVSCTLVAEARTARKFALRKTINQF